MRSLGGLVRKAVFLLAFTTSTLGGQQMHALRITSSVPKVMFLDVAGAAPNVQVIRDGAQNALHLRLSRGAVQIPLVLRSNTAYELSVQSSEGVEIRVAGVQPLAGTEHIVPGALNVSVAVPVSASSVPKTILQGPRISNGGNNSTPNNALLVEVETVVSFEAELTIWMRPATQ